MQWQAKFALILPTRQKRHRKFKLLLTELLPIQRQRNRQRKIQQVRQSLERSVPRGVHKLLSLLVLVYCTVQLAAFNRITVAPTTELPTSSIEHETSTDEAVTTAETLAPGPTTTDGDSTTGQLPTGSTANPPSSTNWSETPSAATGAL